MSNEISLDDLNLTIKDRLNYTYILGVKLLTVDKVMLNTELREAIKQKDVERAINLIESSIPKDYKDTIYNADIEAAKTEEIKDVRPFFSGKRLSVDLCIQYGIEPYKVVVVEDHFKKHQAIIDLLKRLGMLSRIKWIEIPTGRKFDPERGLDEKEILTILGEL